MLSYGDISKTVAAYNQLRDKYGAIVESLRSDDDMAGVLGLSWGNPCGIDADLTFLDQSLRIRFDVVLFKGSAVGRATGCRIPEDGNP